MSTGKRTVSRSNNAMRIGIISEDNTDFESLKVVISKLIDIDGVGFRSKVGNCTRIRNKCVAMAADLNNKKCDVLIVVIDQDRNDYNALKREVTNKLSSSTIARRLVAVPVEELEAWFIADPEGIKKSLGLKRKPNFSGLPESISSPKEKLRDQVFACSGNEIFYQTALNKRIASEIDYSKVYSKCPSFVEFSDFVKLIAA